MINDIDINTHEKIFMDYEYSLEYLRNLRAKNKPVNKLNQFHIYTDLLDLKELESIISFFATQDLKHSKLNLWSDFKLNKDIILTHLNEKFLNKINFLIYDPIVESKNTPLENFKYLTTNDNKHWFRSDIFRILILYKYGGVYVDSDIIFLNSFDLLNDTEFMYQWGGSKKNEIKSACATVMKMNKKSENAKILIKKLSSKKFARKGTTDLGQKLFKKTEFNKDFKILPSAFFDTEWNISLKDKNISKSIRKQWFREKIKEKNHLFVDAFTWHWHGSSNRNEIPITGSKFDLLKSINRKKLCLKK